MLTSIGLAHSSRNGLTLRRIDRSPRSLALPDDAPSQTVGGRGSWRVVWLTILVHADAFRYAPLAYLQALGWWLRRLRVRSRNRIAALAGRSPHAYALWIERHEPKVLASFSRRQVGKSTKIWPVIDCRDDSAGLDVTLNSLAQGGISVEPILIGCREKCGTANVTSPRDLATVIRERAAWLLPMRPGDQLAAGSLAIYAEAAQREHDSWLIYADDDLRGPGGIRKTPHFKPDWNPELFEHHDFISGSSIARVDRQALANSSDVAWPAELTRAALDRGGAPVHLKLVLHHRISRPQPRVPDKAMGPVLDAAPSVTAIIPTRNGHVLLRNCVDGLRQTAYPNIETIIIDNDSHERETLDYLTELEGKGVMVLRAPGPFNYSCLNNMAVKHARGDVLCFLNNDLEMMDPNWLALMIQHTRRDYIGAVGARLLYADNTIQHAGVFTGIGGGAGHAHRFQRADEPGYFQRARLPQRVSAVTAACMVVEREKFLAVDGFDEELFPVAFNDVDLCLKLNARGWQSFYEPRSTLIHHESKSRGKDSSRRNRARFADELAALKRRWKTDQIRDPFHHPQLSPFCEQFLITV